MNTHRHSVIPSFLFAVAVVALAGCGSTMRATRFSHPGVNFSFIERVAVLPFENVSSDQQAGFRVTRLLVTELLASGAVDVVEPGEVAAAVSRVAGGAARPSAEQILALGTELGVQAVIAGTVAQSEVLRSGAAGIPTVTLDAQMIETEKGEIIWAATHTEKGSSFSAKVLGTGGEPLSETTRRCVRGLLATLLR